MSRPASAARTLLGTELVARLRQPGTRPLVVGICGAQGSGKSTLAAGLIDDLAIRGFAAASLSLDDLYLTKREREGLARDVHPLLQTRGVPGTHDVGLGLALFDRIDCGLDVRLPRFDKATDDRVPEDSWTPVAGPLDVLLFEGWCVGARPQPDAMLGEAINRLEREEDPQGTWRAYANAALAGEYQDLFAGIHLLVLLAAPSWEVILQWRTQQERELRSRSPNGPEVMSDAKIKRFIEHYERITKSIIRDMPNFADIVMNIDENRDLLGVNIERFG